MNGHTGSEVAIPLIEEWLVTDKRTIETGRVRVCTETDEHETIVRERLAREHVEVERVPIGAEVAAVPEMREENGTTVIPVVREVLVVEKKLILVEEIRLHRRTEFEDHAEPVVLRSQRAVIERQETSGTDHNHLVKE